METQTQTTEAAPSNNFASQVRQATQSREYKMGDAFPPITVPAGKKVSPVEALPELPVGGKQDAPPPPAEAKIRIGDKEFATYDEAIRYAETSLAKADGIREAAEKFARPTEAPPAIPAKDPMDDFFKEVEDQIFVDPAQAMRKIYAKAVEDTKKLVFDEYKQTKAKEQEEANRQAAWTKTWDDFFVDNKDLSEARELVNYVTETNWGKISDKPLKEALKFVADETRRIGRINREAALPQKTLQQAAAIMAPSTGDLALPTAEATPKTAVDFIAQLNKHRRRAK